MNNDFDKYVSKFNLDDKNIKLKYNHSYRVMSLSKKYARLLNFSEYDIELAGIIGLLHDIGRFEQIKRFDLYDDNINMDHADFGAYLLFDKNLIKNYWKNENDYELIKFAIENHNKLNIPDINDKRMLKFAKLIRDVDKLDIIYIYGYLDEINFDVTDADISIGIINDIKAHRIAKREDRCNINNEIALSFAYVFDINYDIILDEFQDNVKCFYNKVNSNGKFSEIFKEISNYINERRNSANK